MGQGGHSPDCDEAEVCKSQRGPESGTDKDRLIVGSRFWSPPLRNKPLALRVLFSCNLPFSSSASHQHTFTLSYKYQFTHNLGLCATDRPGGFESLELLQERSELLLRRRRQVPHSCLFPERCTLRELAATDTLGSDSGPCRTTLVPTASPQAPHTCQPAAESAGAAAAGTGLPQPAPAASSAAPDPCSPVGGQSTPVSVPSRSMPQQVRWWEACGPAAAPLAFPATCRADSAHQQRGW